MTWTAREGKGPSDSWTPTPDQLTRWEQLALDGVRHGNCIRNFHKLSAKQRSITLQFFGMMEEQRDCPHLDLKGVDLTPVTDLKKQWRCTHCAFIRTGP